MSFPTFPIGRLLLAAALLSSAGCSIKGMATKALADTFAASGTSYSSDDDPRLVRDSIPFALKTMEQISEAQPEHVGLLVALGASFTQYAYAFVQQDVDRLAETDIVRAKEERRRARRLFLRARGYALRALDVRHPGAKAALLDHRPGPRAAALAAMTRDDVPALYWTGASWAMAISDGKDDMALVGQLPGVEAVMARALALDEAWDQGAIHEFYVTYDASRTEAEGGGEKAARAHLARALALASNKKLGPLVSLAESVAVSKQDKAEFTRLLEQVLAADPDQDPPHRLANLVAQQRARWLLDRRDELFAE